MTEGVLASGLIQVGTRTISLDKVDAIFRAPEPIFLSGGFLHVLKVGAWEDLERLHPEGHFFKPNEWAAFSRDFEGEIVGAAQPVAKEQPILHLTDPRGSFANLASPSFEKELLEAGYEKKFLDNSSYFCPSEHLNESLNLLLDIGFEIYDNQKRRVRRLKSVNLETVEGDFEESSVPLQVDDNNFTLLGEGEVGLVDTRLLPFSVKEIKRFKDLSPTLDISALAHMEQIEKVTLGQEFAGQLYPYQQKGLDWISFLYRHRFGGILADEMGLGKSVQVLAFFSQLEAGPLLIVAPTSLLFNWEREIRRFLPRRAFYVHSGPQRKTDQLENEPFILTSYALLRQDEELFSKLTFEAIVFDEAQMIKNPQSQIFKAAKNLSAAFRLSITGTPIENRYEELWAQFHHLMPGLIERHEKSSATIKRRIGPFVLRRRKDEVALDLPEKIEQTVWVEMGEAEEALYQSILTASRTKESSMEVLEAILRLRQTLCHPRLVDSDWTEESAKTTRLMTDIEEIMSEGHKVLVFSQFTSYLNILKEQLSHHNPLYLDGSTKNRADLVDQFQNHEGACLFFISLKAGGVGLNLTAADYVLIADPWWNESVENQAIDRAHRLGRENKVIARRYVTIGSIEEKIIELKERKKTLAHELLDLKALIS